MKLISYCKSTRGVTALSVAIMFAAIYPSASFAGQMGGNVVVKPDGQMGGNSLVKANGQMGGNVVVKPDGQMGGNSLVKANGQMGGNVAVRPAGQMGGNGAIRSLAKEEVCPEAASLLDSACL